MAAVEMRKRVKISGTDPETDNVRGFCPCCGGLVLSNCYYVQDKGFLILWECEASLLEEPTCDFRRVL